MELQGNNQKKRIALFGPYGFGNMGDAALVEAAIKGIKKHMPSARLCGVCQHPENAALRHKIEMYSIYRMFPRLEASSSSQQVAHDQFKKENNQPNSSVKQQAKKNLKHLIKLSPLAHKFAIKTKYFLQPLIDVSRELSFLVTIFRTVRSFDMMLMTGSGQLNEEWGGPWRYPFGLFKWCILARISGCKIAFLSVGAGSVESFWGKFFCKTALRLSHYSSFRDEKTREIIKSWGVRRDKIVPDLAFFLDFSNNAKNPLAQRTPTVGINPIAYCDPRAWYLKNEEKYNDYTDKMSQLCNWILSEGYRLMFIPNEIKMDNLVIDDIISKMKQEAIPGSQVERASISDYNDVYTYISKCDIVIASRFHGLLFSILSNRPAITIYFHYKLSSLARSMGLGNYCLDISLFSLEQVKNSFQEMVENIDTIKQSISDRSNECLNSVDFQFKEISRLLYSSK